MSWFNTPGFFLTWLITGSLSFVVLIFLIFFYGKICWIQTKVWMLAKRGFHLIEHVGLDKVRNYFYLRPKDNKFDFNSGFYLHYKETTTKTKDGLIKPVNSGISIKKIDALDNAEMAALEEKVKNFRYNPDAVSLRWGIPIITYVGNDPNPVNYFERDKNYGAQVIKDMYIRLLATQRYKDMIRMMLFMILSLGATVVILFLLWNSIKTANTNAGVCIQNWNITQTQLQQCINVTARALSQNSTIFV